MPIRQVIVNLTCNLLYNKVVANAVFLKVNANEYLSELQKTVVEIIERPIGSAELHLRNSC